MSIMAIIKGTFPDMSRYLIDRIGGIGQPRYMIAGDIDHWMDLRKQINPSTGRINSYRDIRKIADAEGRAVPSLGTLRNYLGEGGQLRRDTAVMDWRRWFEDFGNITNLAKDEVADLTTPEEWEVFRAEYNMFLGY